MKRSLAIMAMIAGLLQVTMAAAVCLDTKDDLNACRYAAGDAWCVENHRGPYAYADACVKRYGKPGDSPVGGGAVVSGQPTPPSQTAWQALSSMTPSPPRPPDRAPPPPPTKDPAVAKEPTGPYDWHCLIYGLDEDFYSSCSRCQQPLTIISDAQRIGSSVDLLRASSLSGSGEIDSVFISVFTKDKTYASQIAAWKHKEQCEQMKETMLPFMKERQAQILKEGEKTRKSEPGRYAELPQKATQDKETAMAGEPIEYEKFYAMTEIGMPVGKRYRFYACLDVPSYLYSADDSKSQSIVSLDMSAFDDVEEYRRWLEGGKKHCGWIVAAMTARGKIGIFRLH